MYYAYLLLTRILIMLISKGGIQAGDVSLQFWQLYPLVGCFLGHDGAMKLIIQRCMVWASLSPWTTDSSRCSAGQCLRSVRRKMSMVYLDTDLRVGNDGALLPLMTKMVGGLRFRSLM